MYNALLLIAAMAALSAAALFAHRAQAASPAVLKSMPAIHGSTSAVEPAACWRRRVCGRRGCVWRTVCRRRW